MTVFDPYLRHSVRDAERPLREAGPIVFSDEANAWIVTRFADVSAVLRDTRFEAFDMYKAFGQVTARARLALPHLERFLKASLIFRAGPDHLKLRRLLGRTLNSQPLASLAPAMRELAGKLWQECIASGECDVIRNYAEALPSRIIAGVLGLEEPDRQAFYAATYGLMGVYNRGCSIARYRDFDERLRLLGTTIERLFADRRDRPRADGLSRFIEEAASIGLCDDEAAASLIFLYLASVDQTSALIGLGVRRLARHQELVAAVREQKLDVATLVEELLRIESPAPQGIRVAATNVEIGDVPIAAGDMLILLFSSANHDPAQYADAHDLMHQRQRHLAFSEGAHACIGAAFARVELAAALMPVIERPPTSIESSAPVWWPLDATRRLRSLRVRFG